jgi:transposase
LREILNAVLYVLSTGCQWRALPRDLPPRSTVHGWFVRWPCDGVLDRLHFALSQQVRELEGRHASPTAAIVDSQSVKSAEKGGGLSIRSAMTRPRKSRARSVTSSSTRWA